MSVGLYAFGIISAVILINLLLNKSFHWVWFSMAVGTVFWYQLHAASFEKLDTATRDAFIGMLFTISWPVMLLLTLVDELNERLKKLEKK